MDRPLRRGYSLVSVLAALIIFMVALLPLIPLQGKIFRRAHFGLEEEALQLIEQDFESLASSDKVRSKRLKHETLTIERVTTKKEMHLEKITYKVFNKEGHLLFSMVRYHYHS